MTTPIQQDVGESFAVLLSPQTILIDRIKALELSNRELEGKIKQINLEMNINKTELNMLYKECTHYNVDGTSAVPADSFMYSYCNICGASF
jgi:hypothetical protein